MNEKKAFDFLEHTADAYVAAYGRNLAQAFENAAVAMFEVMTDVDKIEEKTEDHVEVQAEDEYALLYNWLEDLLVKFDIKAMLYSRFKIMKIDKTSEGLRLKAKIWGEKFNKKKHIQKVGVKAITYHRMEIIKQPNSAHAVTVKYILDI